MYYIVSNGEDISEFYNLCRILLLFNKICFNNKGYMSLFSQHIFIRLNNHANAVKFNVGRKCGGG